MTRWARIARGSAAAVISTFLALFFHALAGGPVPALPGLVACVVFSAFVCIPLAGVTLPRVRLALAVVLSQFLFHFLFLLFAGSDATVGGARGHVHGTEAVTEQLAALSPGLAHAHDSPMWIGHALAAAVTFAFVRYGERATVLLAEAARLTLRALRFRALGVALPLQPGAIVSSTDARLPVTRILSSVVRYRGPPAIVNA